MSEIPVFQLLNVDYQVTEDRKGIRLTFDVGPPADHQAPSTQQNPAPQKLVLQFPAQGLSRFVAVLLAAAVRASEGATDAEQLAQQAMRGFQISAVPAMGLVVAQGQTAQEKILSVDLGRVRVSFLIAINTLRAFAQGVIGQYPPKPSERPH